MSSTHTEPAPTLPWTPPQRRTPPSMELVFTYALEESVSLARPAPYRHLERWTVTVAAGGTDHDEDAPTIGDAHVVIVNLEAGRDVRDFADITAGAWRDIHEGDIDGSLSQDHPRAEPDGASTATHLLVLERVWVAPEYRGNGLGPIIAAAVIDRLRRGCRLAACFPAPFEGDRRPEDREREIEALERIWAKVGFRPWRDGVWMLDLDECGRLLMTDLIPDRPLTG
jgi:GNAT superfamily N-acetyltransferase